MRRRQKTSRAEKESGRHIAYSWGTDALKDLHNDEFSQPAVRAQRDCRRSGGCGLDIGSVAAMRDEPACPIELGAAVRTEDAVVTNLHAAARKHVLEETLKELDAGDGAVLNTLSAVVTITEADAAILDRFQPIVGQSDSENVSAEIL